MTEPRPMPRKSLPGVPRANLLAILMGALALLITVRVGHVWQDLSVSVGTRTEAQAQPATPAPTTPAPATPAPAAPAPATPAATTPTAAPTAPAAAPAPAAAGGTAPAPATDAPAVDQTAATVPTDPLDYTDEEVDVLQQLAKRREELDQRAIQLDEREALVAAAEQRMDQKLAELKAVEATLKDLLQQRSDQEEKELKSLVKMYENMKPKAAALVFEELDMDILLEVVSRMNERKMAPIMAQMTPTRAKELTFELAQRRQMPITQ